MAREAYLLSRPMWNPSEISGLDCPVVFAAERERGREGGRVGM